MAESRLTDIEAERAVLGSVFLEPTLARDGLTWLRAADFGEPAHRAIWATIEALAGRGEPWDVVTLTSELRAAGRLEEAGGTTYLMSLLLAVPSPAAACRYGEAVRRAAYRRHLAEAGRLLLAAAESAEEPAEAAGPILQALAEEVPGPEVPLFSGAELLAADLPERADLLGDGILPAGGVGAIIGPPKLGKTALGLNVALAVAEGRPFLGHRTTRGRVLYVLGEGGPQLVRDRLRVLRRRYGDEALANVAFVFPEPGGLRVDDPSGRAALVRLTKRFEASLVVLDPLIAFHQADENVAGEMGRVLVGLDHVRREAGAAVLLVHHSRKVGLTSITGSATEARGSSVLHGWLDSALVLGRRPGGEVTLHYELRWAAPPEPVIIQSTDLVFEVVATLDGRRKLSGPRLLDLLRESGPSTAEGLAEVAGTTKRTVVAYLAELQRQGAVGAITGPRGTKTWFAKEEPSDADL